MASRKSKLIPELVVLVGLSCSGKTQYYEREYKCRGYSSYSLSSVSSKYSVKFKQKTYFKFCELILSDLEDGISVVIDDSNLFFRKRRSLVTYVKNKLGNCVSVRCDIVLSSLTGCLCRSYCSGRFLSYSELMRQLKSFQVPYYYEGFDKIDLVSLDECLDIDLYHSSDLDFFELDTSHHRFSLGKHLDESGKYIIDNYSNHSDFLVLYESALNHDIGKFYTKVFIDLYGNKTKQAHYWGHSEAGSYVYLTRFFSDFLRYGEDACLSVEEALFVSVLISWHMAPYSYWAKNKDVFDKDRVMLGERLFRDISILHDADLYAH